MRTKTLLLTAAVFAAGIGASLAQSTVFSVNAVGYVNLSLPLGFSIISNPLNNSNNNLSVVLPTAPDGTRIFRFNPATQAYFSANRFIVDPDTGVGAWSPDAAIPPGEGFFIRVPVATTLTFVGEVPQGALSNSVPPNYSIRASQVPQAGLLQTQLGFAPADGDTVFQWDRATQRYLAAKRFIVDPDTGVGAWNMEPSLGVAEGFFVRNRTGVARSWTRSFSVNTP